MSIRSEFHNNHSCQHDVEYCKQCDEVYCVDCEIIWQKPCTQSHWGYTTIPEPYYGSTTITTTDGTLTTACSHGV